MITRGDAILDKKGREEKKAYPYQSEDHLAQKNALCVTALQVKPSLVSNNDRVCICGAEQRG